MWGIIGGSGFEKFEEFEALEALDRTTPFGQCSEGLKRGRVGGREVVFIPRHGQNHNLSPSDVNYRANIYALKKHGVKQILSFSAVGSLRQDLAPGDMVVPSQYIDRTKSLRRSTFGGEGFVSHVSLAEPTSKLLAGELKKLAKNFSFKTDFDKVSICVEGPYFSTKAESNVFRSFGADIIGMTAFPEYALVREAGLAFLPCSFVTDYDCWKDDIPHVTVAEVMETMKKNNKKAFEAAKTIVNIDSSALEKASEKESGLKNAIMTAPGHISPETQAWLKILLAD